VVLVVVATGFAAPARTPAQTSDKTAAQDNSSAAQGKQGFSIESEMFTYSAMDAESAMVACNIAQKLGATDRKCAPKEAITEAPGVVIISSDSSALSDFQLWRSDMSTMEILTQRASHYCPKQGQRGLISSIGKLLSGTPAGEFISVAKALLTTTTVKTPVEGTILDQTLVNDIAGRLGGLGVPVLIPDTYSPHSLVTIEETRSPFLAKFLALMGARGCMDAKAGGEEAESAAPQEGPGMAEAERDKRAITEAISAFLDSLTRPDVSSPQPPGQGGSAAPPPQQATEQTPTISHLNAVMRADGLAQELGFFPGSNAGDNSPWNVLWLKALESGGDVVASDNLIKGSKITYTGGAVGTYALFHLNGELECSGVFFDLAPPMQLGDIPKLLDGSQPVPAGRLVGGCNPK
jgi:hypothetical protein